MKRKGLTRRQLGAAAVALPALTQNPPPPTDEVEAARAQTRQTSATLRKFRISTLLEPSIVFKA